MGKSTFISAALHVAILLFVLVSLPSSSSMSPLVAVPVDLATQAEITKLKAGMKDAKDDAPLAGKPKVQKQEAVKEKSAKPDETPPAPRPKEAEKKPEPKQPDPKKDEPKKAAEKPKPEPKKEEPKKAEAKPKEKQTETPNPKPKPDAAKKKGSDFDTDRIAALLNKIPDASNEPMPNEEAVETKPVRGQTSGRDLSISVNEIDALRARIAQCWSPPPGGLGAGEIVVKLRLKLNEDGTLVGYPSVANSGSSPFFQAAADSAVRAVYQCQPYALPADKYALWRDMILNFDPSDMYRSG